MTSNYICMQRNSTRSALSAVACIVTIGRMLVKCLQLTTVKFDSKI